MIALLHDIIIITLTFSIVMPRAGVSDAPPSSIPRPISAWRAMPRTKDAKPSEGCHALGMATFDISGILREGPHPSAFHAALFRANAELVLGPINRAPCNAGGLRLLLYGLHWHRAVCEDRSKKFLSLIALRSLIRSAPIGSS